MLRRLAAAVTVTAAVLACAPQAWGFETILQDDARLLQGSNEDVQQAVRQIAALGVDRVRITVTWSAVAPAPRAAKQPAGFHPADPKAYAPRASTYAAHPIVLVDRAVLLADAAGLKVDLDLGFGAPRWAAGGFGYGTPVGAVWRPDPRQYAAFARAMAQRYSGHFDGFGVRLPRVDVFELWDEPNEAIFLQPQFVGRDAVSADVYRGLVQAAYPAIKSVRRDATVLVGATGPRGYKRGRAWTPVTPLRFVRRLACVDERLRPIRTGGCRRFRRVSADGFSHHPYALDVPPRAAGSNPEEIRVVTLNRLTRLLDQLVRRRRISRAMANLWVTEFGYETNDPVPGKPWSLDQQPHLLAEGEYVAQLEPRLRSFSQFLLRDAGTGLAMRAAQRGDRSRVLGSWQTGLFFEDGRPKPAADSFRLTLFPFLRSAGDGEALYLYGHVRPARGAVQARIEQRLGDGSWQPISSSPASGGEGAAQFWTQGTGIFFRKASGPGLRDSWFRLSWLTPNGGWEAGPPQPVQVLSSPRVA